MISEKLNKNLYELINKNKDDINNLKGKILWENSSPTSTIDNDTIITLNDDDYDIILWLFRYSSSVNKIISSHSIKGYGTKVSNILEGGALIPIYAIGYKTGLF